MDSTIGHVVTWKVPSRVSLDALRLAMVAASLDEKLLADMQPRHALARAMREIAREQPRIVGKLPNDAQGRPRMQLDRKHVQDQGIDYQREAIVTLDPTAGVLADDPAIAQEAARLLNEHLAQRLTSDLTRLVQRIVEAAGTDLIPLREQGGAYFIPEGAPVVAKLATLLDEIGGRLARYAVTLGHGTEESIANTLADYLIGEINTFKASIEDLNAEARADVKTRRFERVVSLKTKLDGYRALLMGSADKVAQELEQANASLMAKLGEPAQAWLPPVPSLPEAPELPL